MKKSERETKQTDNWMEELTDMVEYADEQTDRQADRQTDRPTERLTDTSSKPA